MMTKVALAAATLLVGAAAVAGVVWSAADVDTVGRHRFEQELRIPPLLAPRTDAAGRKVFDLDLRSGRSELLPGTRTETWGVNGPHLGPTLRASRGDTVLMRVRNRLPEATTLHWHGMHLPAHADGSPHQPVAPGATWMPSWKIDQPAATLWYHPHPHDRTADHVYRGVAGLWILDDPQARMAELPERYGVDDIPLILQDKRLDDDGRLDFGQHAISPIGRLGDTVLVNGTHDPHLRVRHRRVRLRLLNASTARVYNVGFADDRDFTLVGTDSGLLERPERVRRIQLSVGERAELVVAVRPGERIVLRSHPPELGTDVFNNRFAGGADTLELLELRAAETLVEGPEPPARLADHERLDLAAARTRRFELSGSASINGRRMDMDRIDDVVALGSTEIWEVHNRAGIPHNFHVHDIHFRVLGEGGRRPPAHLRGWKDTVYVAPGETVRFAARFTDYADPRTPYMFHCHILEHEDRGMMGQFVVVQPGDEPEHLGDHP
ncbi:MAG: multicopper oxidase domain-containing protein [Solirubrobacteraceae bacterium]|nr:multicopper oxidase domain-containing protein [Solirubrobacteraceae bacterium]